MRVTDRVRRLVAGVVSTSGRVLIGVADLIAAPEPDTRRDKPLTARVARPDRFGQVAGPRPVAATPVPDVPDGPTGVDAGVADLATLRALALECTLAAAVDPSRTAAQRLATRSTGLNEWTGGRLLQDTERMRVTALEIAASIADASGAVRQRAFDNAVRQRYPWLDDDSAYRLWDHAVLMARRNGVRIEPVAEEPAEPEDGPRRSGGLGGLVGRLRGRP